MKRTGAGAFARTGVAAAIFALSAGAAWAQSYSFSTCGQSGATGPSQGQCDTAYSATTLAGAVTVANGIQAWTVPVSGVYTIVAKGAQGGTQVYAPGYPGGKGATAGGQFALTAGQTVYVLVGQRGGDTQAVSGDNGDIDNAAPGGGGGSFVYTDATAAFPMLAAGGGGSGARCTSATAADQSGSAASSGNRSGSLANGGTGGNGGTSNVSSTDSYWAGGGAGWVTDGTGGDNSTNYDYTPGDGGAEGGRAPRNGGLGGIRWNDGYDEGGDGGFGGGGGGGSDNMGGGGGGGFSGGGGAAYSPCGNEPGGGGGSYSGGLAPVLQAGNNSGDGAVTITFGVVPVAAATPVPATTPWGLGLVALVLAGLGAVTARRSRG
ncbi:MAG: hypothetical protein JSR18_02120 [Proteobacteria bacterium]|nr:hypothetical protein [Pseudomonadota bacterium]